LQCHKLLSITACVCPSFLYIANLNTVDVSTEQPIWRV